MNAYLDSSVLIPYYMAEPLSGDAERVICSAGSVAVSHLGEVEFFCAAARKARRGDVPARGAAQIRARFLGHLERFLYERVPLRTAHYQLARSWLADDRLALATLDALHVAVAALSERTLITADTQQARAAEQLGVATELVGG